MRSIWKFSLGIGANVVDVPQGARALSAAFQGGRAVVYLLVDPAAATVRRGFAVVPTGAEVASEIEAWRFVGSLSTGGSLRLHVFDGGAAIRDTRREIVGEA